MCSGGFKYDWEAWKMYHLKKKQGAETGTSRVVWKPRRHAKGSTIRRNEGRKVDSSRGPAFNSYIEPLRGSAVENYMF